MTVTVYSTPSEPNRITKSLGTGTGYTGTVKDPGEVSVTDPVVLIAASLDPAVNYCYIDTFGRYYYVELRAVRESLTELHCKVDPLMSYSSDILALPAIAARTTTDGDHYSSYLPDELQKMYAYKTICTRLLHTFSYAGDYILITAG